MRPIEMLTGRRAFAGDEVTDILANVLKSSPDWTLPAGHAGRAIAAASPLPRKGRAQRLPISVAARSRSLTRSRMATNMAGREG